MSSTPQLEDGHVRIANELYDRILSFGFKGHQLKVVLAVVRKTYGYRKKEDDISASQIGVMCNIARQHVTTALNSLALRNVITKRPGRFGSIIGIQKNHRLWVSDEQIETPAGSPDIGHPEDVHIQDTCPNIGHVQIMDVCSPDIGQVDSPDFGHTTDNVPKDNPQQTKSCAPQAEREPDEGAAPADRKGRAMTSSTKDLQDRFARFYESYPRKKSRIAAEKAFAKLNPDEQLLTAIIAGIERAMTSGQWSDPKFIPHPATWLNAGGWLDEIQTEYSTEELAVIRLFNEKLGARFGEVPDAPFVEQRAALIREFPTFSKKPNFIEECFDWLSDGGIDVPPRVGFDWIISRAGFTKIIAANNGKSA